MISIADLQRPPDSRQPASATLPLKLERVRTFPTPEFAGMRFLEVQTKSALNRVRGMPFEWSINPYRGCSHACAYCLAGDTAILMADGRTRQLADIRPGDAVYGTVREGPYRRYVITSVLNHWSTVKPAYRVTLKDGTQLIASGDHRFLTERGWKQVTGTGNGVAQRPFLTCDNSLLGTGVFAPPPGESPDYRRGYLCGTIRGDGHLGSSTYARPGRASGDVHRFRLALVDLEALQRSRRYLADHGVATQAFAFQEAAGGRKAIDAIRTATRAGVGALSDLIHWPLVESPDWRKGFLAGIYDAEGSYSCGVLRIHNTDEVIIAQILACFERFGFDAVVERRPNACTVVRLRGGLVEQLRFFHTVDPAITRKRTIEGRAVTTGARLRVVSVEALGIQLPLFDVTTGTGDFIANGVVSHNCFARPTHRYLGLSPLGDFERTIVVKTNLVEVLRRELARPSWTGERVAMGTSTDPYQRCEGRYRLMPGIIAALAQGLTPFSILTKGTLITRDIDALRAAAEDVSVAAALTVGTLDRDLWREVEPGAPSPQARLDAVAALTRAGIPTGVMIAPIMPGLNDQPDALDALVDAAAAAGAVHITPIVLHLRPGVRELFWPWLEQAHPELLGRYAALYRRANAPAEYRNTVEGLVAGRRRAAWARHGRPDGHPSIRSRPRPAPRQTAGPQLRLL